MNKYMKEAIKEAYIGIKAGHGGPFGAVVVKDGKIIAKAHNTVVRDNDPTCHGEMNAIRAAAKALGTFDLSGCEIYSTGFPCPMCMAACQWANISKIYYGANLQDTADIGFRDEAFYIKRLVPIELDRKETLKLYADYKNIKDKTHY